MRKSYITKRPCTINPTELNKRVSMGVFRFPWKMAHCKILMKETYPESFSPVGPTVPEIRTIFDQLHIACGYATGRKPGNKKCKNFWNLGRMDSIFFLNWSNFFLSFQWAQNWYLKSYGRVLIYLSNFFFFRKSLRSNS